MACSEFSNFGGAVAGVSRRLAWWLGLGALVVMTLTPKESHAWLIYHKPGFKGRFIDAETKEPIEGVVVVAVYQKTLVAGFEPITSPFAVRETVTDKDGVFVIPSYTTLTNPLAISSFVEFVVYKPGYGSFFVKDHPHTHIYNVDNRELFFTKKYYGNEQPLSLWVGGGEVRRFTVVYGMAELPRLTTEKERLRAIHGIPGDARFSSMEALPLYYKAVNEERTRFGLGAVGN